MAVPITGFGPRPDSRLRGAPDDGRMLALNRTLARLQARDDAGFIAGELAGLARRQQQAFKGAVDEDAPADDPDTPSRGAAPAFARSFIAGFDRDVTDVLARAASRDGAKPSEDALDLFRRKSEGIRERLFTRAALHEDALTRRALEQSGARAISDLAAMVTADPDSLDVALDHLRPVIAAQGAVLGPEAEARLNDEQPRRLAEAAVGALIAGDPARAMERLDSGAFDEHLDEAARAGFRERAETRRAAVDADRESAARREEAAAMRARERAALSFTGGFRRRMETGEATLAGLADAEAQGT